MLVLKIVLTAVSASVVLFSIGSVLYFKLGIAKWLFHDKGRKKGEK